jgi:anti-sigma regulatory factor (Ser/Thr protein kinase)
MKKSEKRSRNKGHKTENFESDVKKRLCEILKPLGFSEDELQLMNLAVGEMTTGQAEHELRAVIRGLTVVRNSIMTAFREPLGEALEAGKDLPRKRTLSE